MRLKEELEIETYFCLPYHSWQKGTVENSIGLVRRQYPKSTNFPNVNNEELKELQWKNKQQTKKVFEDK
jgi:IS30 family transposase